MLLSHLSSLLCTCSYNISLWVTYFLFTFYLLLSQLFSLRPTCSCHFSLCSIYVMPFFHSSPLCFLPALVTYYCILVTFYHPLSQLFYMSQHVLITSPCVIFIFYLLFSQFSSLYSTCFCYLSLYIIYFLSCFITTLLCEPICSYNLYVRFTYFQSSFITALLFCVLPTLITFTWVILTFYLLLLQLPSLRSTCSCHVSLRSVYFISFFPQLSSLRYSCSFYISLCIIYFLPSFATTLFSAFFLLLWSHHAFYLPSSWFINSLLLSVINLTITMTFPVSFLYNTLGVENWLEDWFGIGVEY